MKVTPRARALNCLNVVLKQGLTMKNSFCVGRCDVEANIGGLIRKTGVIADHLSVADDDGIDPDLATSIATLAGHFADEANRCKDPALAACLRLQSADLWRVLGDSGVVIADEQQPA
jgi:hypothetical protein